MSDISKTLSADEQTLLGKLEHIIEEGKHTFVTVGLALTEIRDKRLYRKEFSSFETYCMVRWKWGASRSRQMIAAAWVVKQLSEEGVTSGNTPTTERQARELAKVPSGKRAEVMRKALKSKGRGSASAIRSASKEVTVHLDHFGRIIPDGVLPFWLRREEVGKHLKILSSLRSDMRRAHDDEDRMYGEVNFTSLLADLNRAYTSLSVALPYAVCTTCQGKPETQPDKECRLCLGRGLISEFRWKRLPAEIRKVVEKQAKT